MPRHGHWGVIDADKFAKAAIISVVSICPSYMQGTFRHLQHPTGSPIFLFEGGSGAGDNGTTYLVWPSVANAAHVAVAR